MIDQPLRVPPMALLLSCGALAVPVLAALFFAEAATQYEVLLWLLALVPAFLLSYYRGWRGAATGTAAAMAAFALTQAGLVALDRDLQSIHRSTELLLGLLGVAVGVGWLAERLLRDRGRAQQLALLDELTGLPNRRYLELFLRSNFAAAQRGRAVAVVLFDIDRFKAYNDRHGHAAGDDALRKVAGVMRSVTRDMDLCGRWGGEEFLAVLTVADEHGATVFAERVRTRLEALPLDHAVSVSGGIACYRPDMASLDELIAAADSALYRAKTDGRNRIRVAGAATALTDAPVAGDEHADQRTGTVAAGGLRELGRP
jgi:diguanylate cyclase (GGDEF)-like protein